MTANEIVTEKAAQLSEMLASTEKALRDFLQSRSPADSEKLEDILRQIGITWTTLESVLSTAEDAKYVLWLKRFGNSMNSKEKVLSSFNCALYGFDQTFRRYIRQIEDGSFLTRLDGIQAAHMHDDPLLRIRDVQLELRAVLTMWDRSQT